jgi:cardiolipin synthase (CMP-forming)
MAVATDGGKAQPRRTAEHDVNLVLARSPVNWANVVTTGRLLLVLPIVWLITAEHFVVAFWVFIAAGLSDALDGYIAKNFNARTVLGAYLDPLADKLLLNGIYVALALIGWLPVWLVLMVVSRDVLIVLGVILIQRRNPVFRATPLLIGKANTFAQLLLAACLLAHGAALVDMADWITPLIGFVAITTLLSGGGYIAQALRALGPERPS